MYQVLSDLNKTSGITGSMVVGGDGIVIAADLDESFDGDTIGALAASITSNIQKSLERLETRPLRQVTRYSGGDDREAGEHRADSTGNE
jgi:predicted regulator of Ras-like GTPase activity (Roadblock/LC7/MglB family)